MNSDATFQNAKRLYLEQYGDPMVTNTYLKIALVLVSLVPSTGPCGPQNDPHLQFPSPRH